MECAKKNRRPWGQNRRRHDRRRDSVSSPVEPFGPVRAAVAVLKWVVLGDCEKPRWPLLAVQRLQKSKSVAIAIDFFHFSAINWALPLFL